VLKNSESAQNFVIRKNYAVVKGNTSVSGNNLRVYKSESKEESKSKSKGHKKLKIHQNLMDDDLPMQSKDFANSRSGGTKRPIYSPEENLHIFKKPKNTVPFITGDTPLFGLESERSLDHAYVDMQPGPKKSGKPKPVGIPKKTSAYLKSIRTESEKMKEKLVQAPAQRKALTKHLSGSASDNFDQTNYLMHRPNSIIPDSMGGSGLFYSEWVAESVGQRPSSSPRIILNQANNTNQIYKLEGPPKNFTEVHQRYIPQGKFDLENMQKMDHNSPTSQPKDTLCGEDLLSWYDNPDAMDVIVLNANGRTDCESGILESKKDNLTNLFEELNRKLQEVNAKNNEKKFSKKTKAVAVVPKKFNEEEDALMIANQAEAKKISQHFFKTKNNPILPKRNLIDAHKDQPKTLQARVTQKELLSVKTALKQVRSKADRGSFGFMDNQKPDGWDSDPNHFSSSLASRTHSSVQDARGDPLIDSRQITGGPLNNEKGVIQKKEESISKKIEEFFNTKQETPESFKKDLADSFPEITGSTLMRRLSTGFPGDHITPLCPISVLDSNDPINSDSQRFDSKFARSDTGMFYNPESRMDSRQYSMHSGEWDQIEQQRDVSFTKFGSNKKSFGFNKSSHVSFQSLNPSSTDMAEHFLKNVNLIIRIQSAWRGFKAREAAFVRQIEKRDTTQKTGQLFIKVFDEDLGLMEPYKVMVFENPMSGTQEINLVARCLSKQTKKFGLTLDSSAMLELSSLPGGVSLGIGLPEYT
jgi:hypothetical protein